MHTKHERRPVMLGRRDCSLQGLEWQLELSESDERCRITFVRNQEQHEDTHRHVEGI